MKFQSHLFSVTRQRQWPEGALVVEINQGGFDYCNPDMLVPRFGSLGEGDTFSGMTDAVEAAIKVYRAWKETTKEKIGIAVGNTGGNTAPFEGHRLTKKLEAALREKARKFDESLPKCAHCGDILTDEKWGPHWLHHDEYDCCSSNCADNHYCTEDEEELIES